MPGELGKYFSVLGLHAWPEPNLLTTVVGGALVPLAAAVVREGFLPDPEPEGFLPEPVLPVVIVLMVVVSGLVNEIAFAVGLVFSHAVLT